MRHFPAVNLFLAACLCCVLVVSGVLGRHFAKPKCQRMFGGSDRWVGTTCTYVCQGWPIRSENEEDGVACRIGFLQVSPGVCLKGQCVDIARYPTTAAKALSSASSRTPLFNAQTTAKLNSQTDGLFVHEATTLSTDYKTDKVSSDSDVSPPTHELLSGSRQTTRQQSFTEPLSGTPHGHTVGSSLPTRQEFRTTPKEFTTTRAPSTWGKDLVGSMETIGNELLTSSAHQDHGLSSTMEGATSTDVPVSSFKPTASSSFSSLVHRGETRPNYDATQPSTLARQKRLSTVGPTTPNNLVTSSASSGEEFAESSTRTNSPFGTVSDKIPEFRVTVNEAIASKSDSTEFAISTPQESAGASQFSDTHRAATVVFYEDIPTYHRSSPGRDITTTLGSTYDKPSASSAASGPISSKIVSSSTASGDSPPIASSTSSTYSAGSHATSEKEQVVSETEGEHTSMSHPTMLHSFPGGLTSSTMREIASGSTDPTELSTKTTHAMEAVTQTSNPVFTETTATARDEADKDYSSPEFTRHSTPPVLPRNQKLTSASPSHRLSAALSAFIAAFLILNGLF